MNLKSDDKINKSSHNVNNPPEVTTSVPLASTVGLADSSSNYLPVNGKATPRDRGSVEGSDEGCDGSSIMGMMEDGSKDVLDVTSSGMKCSTRPQMEPAADLREAKGEVNREAVCRTTSGGSASRMKNSTVPQVEPGSDLRELEGEVNREGRHGEWKKMTSIGDGRNVTSGVTPSGRQGERSSVGIPYTMFPGEQNKILVGDIPSTIINNRLSGYGSTISGDGTDYMVMDDFEVMKHYNANMPQHIPNNPTLPIPNSKYIEEQINKDNDNIMDSRWKMMAIGSISLDKERTSGSSIGSSIDGLLSNKLYDELISTGSISSMEYHMLIYGQNKCIRFNMPIVFMMSLISLMIVVLNRIDMVEDIYCGIHEQLIILNEMLKNDVNDELLKSFLTQIINTIEPTLFIINHSNINHKNFNILGILEESDPNNVDLHKYFGTCITFAILETIIGILRNWIYKFNCSKFNINIHIIPLEVQSNSSSTRLHLRLVLPSALPIHSP